MRVQSSADAFYSAIIEYNIWPKAKVGLRPLCQKSLRWAGVRREKGKIRRKIPFGAMMWLYLNPPRAPVIAAVKLYSLTPHQVLDAVKRTVITKL